MTFTTLTFIVFLAVVFTAYWLLRNRTAQNALLVLASYFFYAWWDWRFCSLMLISSLVDYSVGLGLGRARSPAARRVLLVVSIVCNLTLLGFFKYFKFFAANFRLLVSQLGWNVDPLTLHIILPVGISFYTFQTMSYTIDVFRRRVKPTANLLDYCTYVSFFPQLVAGPIERAGRLLPQFTSPRRFDYEQAVDGCRQILWGFFKKMVLADNLAALVSNSVYAYVPASTGPQLALGTVCFAFQIYCDFSAYSDIAIGTAKLFCIRLMRNFAYPYFSQNLGEFWHRWHISLSTWFRDYVYIPMGGSRVPRLRKALNILVTFVVSGFWHGAAWHFLAWGLIHGLGVTPRLLTGRSALKATDVPGGERLIPSAKVLGRMLLTFGIVCVGWVFFRAETVSDALLILQKMCVDVFNGSAYVGLFSLLAEKHRMARTLYFLLAFVVVEWCRRNHEHPLALTALPGWVRWLDRSFYRALWALAGLLAAPRLKHRLESRVAPVLPPRWLRWTIYTALIWITLDVGTKVTSAFIYFQF